MYVNYNTLICIGGIKVLCKFSVQYYDIYICYTQAIYVTEQKVLLINVVEWQTSDR